MMAEAADTNKDQDCSTVLDKTAPTSTTNKAENNQVSIEKSGESGEELECAVCLQQCIHPVRLPCKHIFCFLCVKGVANQSKRCAMCRQEIPATFLDHPDLLNNIDLEAPEDTTSGYQWFYEGRNGWWRYDARSNKDIEEAFNNQEQSIRLLIAGTNYDIDFLEMKQRRTDIPSSSREIKRDLVSSTSKGVAGLSSYSVKRPPESNKPGKGRKKRKQN